MKVNPRSIANGATHVIGRLQKAGFEAYLVGGAVRDLLLDRQPKDHDIATSASPEEVRRVFGRRSRIIGRRFRLVHVYADQSVYEVSTFRRRPDMAERRGRESDSGLMVWRDNCFGTIEQDARRRDFTVNALYYDPLVKGGKLVDLVGGLKDIETNRIQMIGTAEERLAEDPVRTIRACKLAGQYGFKPDNDLKALIVDAAQSLSLCSNARLVEEIYKIIKKPHTCATLVAADEFGVLEHFLPSLAAGWCSENGELCRRILCERDRMIANDIIYPSRVTGIAMLLFAFLKCELEPRSDASVWSNFAGIDAFISRWSREFLRPYQFPRNMIAKVRDVLLLQPKFQAGKLRQRLRRHPEFQRARDTHNVLKNSWKLSKHGHENCRPELTSLID